MVGVAVQPALALAALVELVFENVHQGRELREYEHFVIIFVQFAQQHVHHSQLFTVLNEMFQILFVLRDRFCTVEQVGVATHLAQLHQHVARNLFADQVFLVAHDQILVPLLLQFTHTYEQDLLLFGQ